MQIRRSYIWALLIAGGVTAWMVSGQFASSPSEAEQADAAAEAASPSNESDVKQLTINALRVSNSQTPLQVRASGVTRTAFDVEIINRRKAFVANIPLSEGRWVKKGDVLIELAKGTLEADIAASRADRQAALAAYEDAKKRFSADGTLAAQLNAAESELASIKATYEANEALVKRGLQTQLSLTAQRAQLAAAETRLFELQSLSQEKELSASYSALKAVDARLAMLQEQLSFTTITAPQDGWLETISVEVGEFAGENAMVAHLLGLQELVVDVPVPQARINDISLGDTAQIDLIGQGQTSGVVSKIAATANSATRTFTVEITLDNQDGALRAGMSAEASITIGSVDAFEISPAHLNVNEDGQLTAKIVGADDKVQTVEVELVRTSGNSAYISGLADNTVVLAAGQAFLSEGESVRYRIQKGDEENS